MSPAGPPMIHTPLPTLALVVLLGGCATDLPTVVPPSRPPAAVHHVVLVSVDGLRGDALSRMPFLSALLPRAVWTDSMQTIVPSLTVPGHLAMFTGRDVSSFGITTNVLDEAAGLTLAFNQATAVFQWAQAAGGHTVALAGTSLIPQSELSSAQSFFGVDTIISAERDLQLIANRAVELAGGDSPPALLFIHIPTVDFAGHDFGWIRTDSTDAAGGDLLGPQYLDAVHAADAAVARIWGVVSASVDSGTTAFILAADHGGGHGVGCVAGIAPSREHCTSQPGDREIPFVLIMKNGSPRRLASATRITQIAPTIGRLLGLEVPTLADSPLPY